MPGTNTRPLRQTPDVLLQDLNGEAVLLNLKNGQYYGLDENSYRMYTALVSAGSLESACEVLAAEYEVEADRLRADLGKFLADLLENGLLVYADEKPG